MEKEILSVLEIEMNRFTGGVHEEMHLNYKINKIKCYLGTGSAGYK
jgi:hypothetical protein